jgi:energy-coupling factor transport system permease protein
MSLEFSRNVTFGQYIDISSPVHRLDPRIKMLSVACIMICTFMTRGFISLIPIVTLAVLIQITTRIPVGYTLRGYRLLFRTMLLFIPFQILFYRAPAGVIVEPYWQWWVLSISSNGIIAGLYTLSRVVLLYHTINMLMFTTTMIDLSDGAEIMFDVLKKLRIPVNELVMTMTVALKFVPLLITELERLIRAQTARGVRFDQGGVIERTKKIVPVLIPLFVNALNRAEVLIVAMNARCYRGGDGRTKLRTMRIMGKDLAAFALILALAVSAAYLGRTYGV